MTPSIEKTPIGMQYVIPGAERVAKPRRRTEGAQLVVQGAERISTREFLERLAEKPIALRHGQVGLRGTGLFEKMT